MHLNRDTAEIYNTASNAITTCKNSFVYKIYSFKQNQLERESERE